MEAFDSAMLDTKPLVAGRELDALVAEKVMGAVWTPTPSDMVFDEDYWLEIPGKPGVFAYRYRDGRVKPKAGCPPYSTDMASAWEVVEKMEQRGHGFALADSQGPPWEATFDNLSSMLSYIETADTAPLAICLAALKAVES